MFTYVCTYMYYVHKHCTLMIHWLTKDAYIDISTGTKWYT